MIQFCCSMKLLLSRQGEVCSHVAAVLFKIETVCRLGLNKPSCTSTSCGWKNWYKENVSF